MFICKYCNEEFDSVNRVPMIMPCGHTFCKSCVLVSINESGKLDCLNCFYVLKDTTLLIINHILNDRTSLRETASTNTLSQIFSNQHSKPNFYSSRKIDQISAKSGNHPPFMEEPVADMNKASIPLISDFQNTFTFNGQAKEFNPSRKCKNGPCQRLTTAEFCSNICSNQQLNRSQNTSSPTPARIQANPHAFGKLTPFKEGGFKVPADPGAIFMQQLTPKGSKAILTSSQQGSHSTTKKFRAQSPFTSRKKCKNPNCNNPRYIFNDVEADYCGKICEELFEGRSKSNTGTGLL
jgi:hypothetical protein